MENKNNQTSPLLVGLGILILVAGAATAVVYLNQLVQFFVRALSASQPPVQAAVIAGSATVLVSVASLILTARNQKKREIEAEHRKQKAEIYEEFIKSWFELIYANKTDEEVPEEKILVMVINFSQRMMIWGSDEVLKEYRKFRSQFGNEEEPDPIEMLKSFENIIFAMRKDLGHSNKNIGQKDLLALIINDLDKSWP